MQGIRRNKTCDARLPRRLCYGGNFRACRASLVYVIDCDKSNSQQMFFFDKLEEFNLIHQRFFFFFAQDHLGSRSQLSEDRKLYWEKTLVPLLLFRAREHTFQFWYNRFFLTNNSFSEWSSQLKLPLAASSSSWDADWFSLFGPLWVQQ